MTAQSKTGDWAKARRLLSGGPSRLGGALDRALRQEGELLRKEIVQGLTKQAPGGDSLRQPSPLTLAARQLRGRGGSKALLVRGDLRNAIAVVARGGKVFVGVPRKARNEKGQPVIDVAQVQEFGADPVVIPMTPAMRRFLFVLLRQAGKRPSGGSGRGVVVVTVPPRPFLRPAFNRLTRGAQRRFLARVAGLMGLPHTAQPDKG